jgi:hypothetical protein
MIHSFDVNQQPSCLAHAQAPSRMALHPAVVDLDQVPQPHEERGTRRRPAISSLASKSSVPVRRTTERLPTARCAVAGAPILIGRTRRAGKAATRSGPPTASTLLGACAVAKLPADRRVCGRLRSARVGPATAGGLPDHHDGRRQRQRAFMPDQGPAHRSGPGSIFAGPSSGRPRPAHSRRAPFAPNSA